MKKAFLLLLLFSSFFAGAQSLKEALFSGRLKNDAGSVIRKGDDLSTKMVDTLARKTPARDTLAVITVTDPANPGQQVELSQKEASVSKPADSNAQVTAQASATINTPVAGTSGEANNAEDETEAAADAGNEPAVKAKSNTVLWKEYITNLLPTLKAEVLSSKKVEKGSYYVLLSYAIDTDGQTTITDVFVSPENEFLQQQISQRIGVETPKLAPVLNSAGNARKVNKKYNFTIEKE